jgi:uracil phosphoribosyltransferase
MLHLVEHPLIQTELTRLRDRNCPPDAFRAHVHRIATLMMPAVTADFETVATRCETPLEETEGKQLAKPVVLAPILRAGIGFFSSFLDLLPGAATAHIGLARNEVTLEPDPYYFKAPTRLPESEVIVLDPMLATGGSACAAVDHLITAGARSIRLACLVAAPEGLTALETRHPTLPVFAAALDRCLDENGYILPGLGDAGDRIFGT